MTTATVRDIYDGKDPRDLPRYTMTQAARIVRVPVGTLRAWALGRTRPDPAGRGPCAALIEAADRRARRLSFVNLVELHVLSTLRGRRIDSDRIRDATRFVAEELETEHPLAAMPVT